MPNSLPRQSKDLTGERYGKLVVVAFSHSDKGCWWHVRCDCGSERVMYAASLKRSLSCGCFRRERDHARIVTTGYPALWKRLHTSYKNNARQRGITWQLSEETFFHLVKRPCHYCGEEPSGITHNGKHTDRHIVHSGLDRVENAQGYVEGNVVSCCSICNLAKRKMNTAEFLGWAKRLVAHQETLGD